MSESGTGVHWATLLRLWSLVTWVPVASEVRQSPTVTLCVRNWQLYTPFFIHYNASHSREDRAGAQPVVRGKWSSDAGQSVWWFFFQFSKNTNKSRVLQDCCSMQQKEPNVSPGGMWSDPSVHVFYKNQTCCLVSCLVVTVHLTCRWKKEMAPGSNFKLGHSKGTFSGKGRWNVWHELWECVHTIS